MLRVQATADIHAIRTDSFAGREFLVVPVVALIEGVIHSANSTEPELALAAEFGKIPAAWDGRPVIMNHPVNAEGVPVSANSPSILASIQFGMMFNTKLDDTKLKTEAWIDVARVSELGGEIEATVTDLKSGKRVVEISTGLFCDSVRTPGVFEGKKYSGIWREINPDHLAFLSEGKTGACSVEGGCGAPRLNEKKKDELGFEYSFAVGVVPDLKPNKKGCTCEGEKVQPGMISTRLENIIQNSHPDSMVDRDVRILLQQVLRKAYGNSTYLLFHTVNDAIFEAYGVDGYDGYYSFSIGYNIANNTKVTFTSSPVQVNVLTRIEPVLLNSPAGPSAESASALSYVPNPTFNSEDIDMTTQQTQNSSATGAPASGAAAVPGSQTAPGTTLIPPASQAAAPQIPVVNTTVMAPPAVAPSELQAVTPPRVLTTEEYLAGAPPEIRASLRSALRLQNERKAEIIRTLRATNRCDYSDAELTGMELENLERLVKLSAVPNYAGMGGANLQPHMTTQEENKVPDPPKLFDFGATKVA